MRRIDIVRRAASNLKRAKLRTFLTALAISVGAFTITLALAAGTGAKQYTDTLISSNGDQDMLMVYAKQSTGQLGQNASDPTPYDPERGVVSQDLLSAKDISRIEATPGIAEVVPLYSISATYMYGPSGKKFDTSLVPKYDQSQTQVVAGSLGEGKLAPGTAIVSKNYIAALGYKSPAAAIGQDISVHVDSSLPGSADPEGRDYSYQIVAVDSGSQYSLDYQDSIRIGEADARSVYEYQTGASSRYFGATATVKSGADVDTVKQAVVDAGYEAISQRDLQSILFTFVNVVMGGVAGFGALAILASIFGIINTQYISVLERTQQIGLMKALGASRRDIAKLFRYEAAWVGFLGGLIGTGLALLVWFTNPLIASALGLEKGTNLLVYRPEYSALLIVGLMLVAIASGWLPSRKAARIDPIEALRTE